MWNPKFGKNLSWAETKVGWKLKLNGNKIYLITKVGWTPKFEWDRKSDENQIKVKSKMCYFLVISWMVLLRDKTYVRQGGSIIMKAGRL